jgi:hypothetical protein
MQGCDENHKSKFIQAYGFEAYFDRLIRYKSRARQLARNGEKIMNLKEASIKIKNLEDFKAGNLRGRKVNFPFNEFFVKNDLSSLLTQRSFVVVSYNTPIAIVTEDGNVYFTEQKYSVTTSRHLGLAKRSLLE